MADLAGIDFNAADHRQRKLLRVALMGLFRRERALAMFLDEEMDLKLADEVEDGKFKEQVWELVILLSQRGKLNRLMKKIGKSEEFADAPALRDLLVTWSSVLARAPASRPEAADRPAPIERILDGEVNRIRPADWVAGIAALRRRLCLLRRDGSPVATGVLISSHQLLTSAHVVHGPPRARGGQLEAVFDYGIGAAGAGAAQSVAVDPPTVIDPPEPQRALAGYLESLDYALLPLTSPMGDELIGEELVRGWFDLTDMRVRLREDESIQMLHHPGGRAMFLSNGSILPDPARRPTRFAHSCAVVGGPSGAPVIDATLRLVGLHEMKHSQPKDKSALSIAVRADRIARDLGERGVELTAPPQRTT